MILFTNNVPKLWQVVSVSAMTTTEILRRYTEQVVRAAILLHHTRPSFRAP
jgi:hypothetical protein